MSGQIVTETPHTKIGQFHTLDLELQRNFTVEKQLESSDEVGGWDSIAIQQLKDAVDEGGNRRAEAVAVVMQEGLANICFIGQFQTILKQKVEMSIPRKRQGGSDHDKVNSHIPFRFANISEWFALTTLCSFFPPGFNKVLSNNARYAPTSNRL